MLESRGERGRLAPTAFLVAGILGLGSLAPVLRDSLVAARLGASNESDAYFLATYIMLMVVTILVADSFTPASVVSLSSARRGTRAGLRLHYALAGAAIVLVAVAALVALLADPLVIDLRIGPLAPIPLLLPDDDVAGTEQGQRSGEAITAGCDGFGDLIS